jgi:hypothetical protein
MKTGSPIGFPAEAKFLRRTNATCILLPWKKMKRAVFPEPSRNFTDFVF